jgi:hypothetical protein
MFSASTQGIEKPMPENSYKLNMAGSLAVSLSRNETTGVVLGVSTSSCQTVQVTGAPAGVTVSLFHMPTMTTTQPSSTTAILGKQYDPLVPLYTTSNQVCATDTFVWADISVASTVAAGTYTFNIQDLPVTLTVWNLTMPTNPTMPIYIPFIPYTTLAGHGLPGSSSVAVEASLAASYLSALRAHRIEPIEQMIAYPPINSNGVGVNLDQYSAYGASFRQTELTGNIAPVCMQVTSPIGASWASPALLAAWEQSYATEPGLANAWAYVTDEPSDLTGLATRAQLVRTYAPHIKTMVTHEPTTALLPLIDHFTTVYEYFKTAGHWMDYTQAPGYWLYGSCMSHGSCGGGTGRLTGSPDLMLDEPDVMGRAFALVGYANGAQAELYYASTQAYGSMNPWVTQYQFAGNGDGNLFYPGIAGQMGFTDQEAVASIRLKAMRQGQYDIEYVNMAKAAGLSTNFMTLVPDQFKWSRNNSDYDAMRMAIGNALSH